MTSRRPDAGGLAGALGPALAREDGVWLGWTGDEAAGPIGIAVDAGDRSRASFDVPAPRRDHTVVELCNRALWPVFHGFRHRVHLRAADWLSYCRANDAYARFALELADLDAAIWIHDYQLLLAGRALRRLGHRGRIGLFLHTPFPSRDLFETLPWATEIIDALLDHDLIGFQTQQWADNFLACARGHRRATVTAAGVQRGNRLTRVEVFPMTIDGDAFARRGEPVTDALRLRAELGDRRVLLGVDRLDHARGIVERLHAFERLLERFPLWQRKVVLLQVASPSRGDHADHAELRLAIETLVGRINGRFGETDWVPVRYLYRAYDRAALAELYRLADVALATPLRDGMSVFAKEFVAAQDPLRPGVLVLSQFAGAAEEMAAALLTNPFYPEGFAADLDRALRMPPDERVRRQHVLLDVIRRNGTPEAWAERFLDRLRAAGI